MKKFSLPNSVFLCYVGLGILLYCLLSLKAILIKLIPSNSALRIKTFISCEKAISCSKFYTRLFPYYLKWKITKNLTFSLPLLLRRVFALLLILPFAGHIIPKKSAAHIKTFIPL